MMLPPRRYATFPSCLPIHCALTLLRQWDAKLKPFPANHPIHKYVRIGLSSLHTHALAALASLLRGKCFDDVLLTNLTKFNIFEYYKNFTRHYVEPQVSSILAAPAPNLPIVTFFLLSGWDCLPLALTPAAKQRSARVGELLCCSGMLLAVQSRHPLRVHHKMLHLGARGWRPLLLGKLCMCLQPKNSSD